MTIELLKEVDDLRSFKKFPLIIAVFFLTVLVCQNPIKTYAATNVTIDPNTTYQTIEGWGSSICWWGNQIGSWSADNRNKLIEKIVSPSDGLGYNIFRYNIGGGDAPSHNHMRDFGEIEGYQNANGTWNWNADATQRAVLNRLIERGEYYGSNMILEAFSNSPPYWMTKSGCASGSSDGSNNLKDDYYDDFAEYLTEVVKHFRDESGITFRTLAPMNEPNVSWWKSNGSQEGCSFSYANQQKIIKEVGIKLKSKGLTGTTVSAADENSIDTAYSGLSTYDSTTLSYVSQANTHSYSGSKRTQYRDLAKSKGLKIWQSESGPLSFNGNMADSCIMLSKRIVTDLKEMQCDAWLDWQIIDGGNWGSFYVNNSAQTFTLTEKFYMHSNYSRFIKPGYKIIGADNANTVATISPDKKKLVIVATNDNASSGTSFAFNLSKFANVNSSVEVYRTSPSLNLVKSNITAINKNISDTLPAYSINTYVITLDDSTPAPTPLIVTLEPSGETICEAEDAYGYNAGIESSNANYSGIGYINYYNEVGGYIEWTVSAPYGASSTLNFRYANGSTSNRPMEIEVNGTVLGSLDFNTTGDWTTWKDQSIRASLNKGTNTIRATSKGVEGGPNTDYLGVSMVQGTTSDYIYGDLNGDKLVNSIDFALLRNYLLGFSREFPYDNGIKAADVNRNGAVDSIDFAILRSYLLGNVKTLPVAL